MRKNLLAVLLCTALTATVLSGCGNKETIAEPAESTPIKETVVEESSEPASVEETTTPEPTKPVVEVDEEVKAAKDEALPEFTVMNMDFGTLVRLGDNEDYPDALENLEIHYMGKVFQVALPKDMCVKFKFDNEAQQLDVYNKDESKRLWIFFTDTTTTIENKKPMDLETAKNVTTYYGLSMLDDVEVIVKENTDNLIFVHVPAYIENSHNGEFISYKSYTNETTEWEDENGTTNTSYLGTSYYVFYGDKDNNANLEISSYIAESFKVVEYEDSYAASIKPELGEDNKMDTTTMAKYGLPEGELTFPGETTLKDVQGRLDISIAGATEEEMIAFMDDFSNLVELTDLLGVCETMDGKGIVEGSKTVPMLEMSFENGGVKYTFIVTNIQGNYTLTINKM